MPARIRYDSTCFQASNSRPPACLEATGAYGELLATAGRRAEGLRWMREGASLLARVAGPSGDLTAEARRRLARYERSAAAHPEVAMKGVEG